ncbi:MAG TPA: ornithine cyclodeaminase, partial [Chloroflexota bacterium]|nr:ornithine cyclodeaminase [Chloroflexota bacterium]
MLAIGRADIQAAVTIYDAIDAARTAFIALSSDRGTVPPRPHILTVHGTSLIMPAYSSELSTVGVKVVTVTPGNPRVDLPTVQGIVVLFDEESGSPVALIEGNYLTQLRTGAAIGFAADLLARQDAHRVTVFGAGPVARMSLAAVCAVRKVDDVRIVNRNRDRFNRFVAAIEDLAGASCPRPRWFESP